GVEVRPIRTILGESEFSEVFFDKARVPIANRVGEENDGWRVANVTLRFERGTSFAGWIVELRQLLHAIEQGAEPGVLSRAEIGRAMADLDALWALLKLSVSEAEATGSAGASGSIIKLAYSELYQRIADMGRRGLGRRVRRHDDLLTKAMH